MLDLGLGELSHTQQTSSRRNLIAVRLPDLSRCKGQLVTVEVQELAVEGNTALSRVRDVQHCAWCGHPQH